MVQIYIGIEVDRDCFVVATRLAHHFTPQRPERGIAVFLKVLPSQTGCIREVTGVYRHAVG